jgi:RNA polymerase sigma-70 factor, ECF subfamily
MAGQRSSALPVPGETQLVLQAQAGNADAFARLYNAYVGPLYRYVALRVNDDAAAEDITSQVFLKAWDKLGSFQQGRVPFLSWLFRIAHNAVIDHYRTHKTPLPLDDASPEASTGDNTVEDQIEGKFESDQLRAALQQLTADQQQVLILRFVAEMDTSEIARELGKNPGAVRALQMRGLQALAKILEPTGWEQMND